ncbi:integration host factor, actinobacterial type [Streptomyces sp. 135]|uniref:integration host factor, actinobacterial type n=1 Tax=Streptomyces sp. 135 TaxID=2838850 RepID=UPI001CBCAE54|nr:integration host factor, actinobacterial type [Streptomyces sp. 135]
MTPLPNLTKAQRQAALDKALVVRRERAEIRTGLKEGRIPLREVLEREDDVAGKMRLHRVLESMPGIGTARSVQLLESLGISERRRVRGLSAGQRERLLAVFERPGVGGPVS